jgi:basic membrane protein A and related proteins
MTKKVISLILVCVLALTLVFATGCGTSTAEAKTKVGFIFVGPAKDGGWSEAHFNGMNAIHEKLGVEVAYKELVPEGPDCVKPMKDLIDQGCNVIFATSFGYMDYVAKLAKENPKVKFFHCSGYTQAVNMTSYFGKMYEARYLSGIVAGMKTKANKIGYVAAMQLPETVNGINAFTLGVRSVNPSAVVKVRWVGSWIDAAKAKDAAVALLDEGCDVLTQHHDATAVQIAAEQRGAFAIGYDLDSKDAAPKAYITAPVWNWAPYYIDQVKAIMNGTWKSGDYAGTLKDGILDLAPLTANAPDGAKEKVDAARKAIEDGSLYVFTGPLKDQTGKMRVEAGKQLDYKSIAGSMDWFLEGIEGKIESK